MPCSHKETFLLLDKYNIILYQTIKMLYMYVAAGHLIGLIIVSWVCDQVNLMNTLKMIMIEPV